MIRPTIADKIEHNIPRLIENWTRTVREDPRIQSDANLSTGQLIDHVPAIVEEICSLIRKGETPDVRNSDEARVNAYTRLHQGYRGRDLVRELSQLRIKLLEQLMEIASDQSFGVTAEDQHAAATIINLYLDEEMRYVISIYGDQSPTGGAAPA